MHDTVIRGGTIVDGSGKPGYTGDVALEDGKIAQVGGKAGPGKREIDADGLLVTPGWVDVHTHYDGQAMWDSELAPSSWHGVSTVLFGNCGVGFAPVRNTDHSALIGMMESIEEIPGHRPGRRIEVELGDVPGISRCAGPEAARDRYRGADPASSAARLCDGRSRDPPGEGHRRRHPADARRGAAGAEGGGVRLHDLAHQFAQDARRATWFRAVTPKSRSCLGIGSAFNGLNHGAFGVNSDFDDEAEELKWMTQVRPGERPSGVVPADRPADRPVRWRRLMDGVHKARARRRAGYRADRRPSGRRAAGDRYGAEPVLDPAELSGAVADCRSRNGSNACRIRRSAPRC